MPQPRHDVMEDLQVRRLRNADYVSNRSSQAMWLLAITVQLALTAHDYFELHALPSSEVGKQPSNPKERERDREREKVRERERDGRTETEREREIYIYSYKKERTSKKKRRRRESVCFYMSNEAETDNSDQTRGQ